MSLSYEQDDALVAVLLMNPDEKFALIKRWLVHPNVVVTSAHQKMIENFVLGNGFTVDRPDVPASTVGHFLLKWCSPGFIGKYLHRFTKEIGSLTRVRADDLLFCGMVKELPHVKMLDGTFWAGFEVIVLPDEQQTVVGMTILVAELLNRTSISLDEVAVYALQRCTECSYQLLKILFETGECDPLGLADKFIAFLHLVRNSKSDLRIQIAKLFYDRGVRISYEQLAEGYTRLDWCRMSNRAFMQHVGDLACRIVLLDGIKCAVQYLTEDGLVERECGYHLKYVESTRSDEIVLLGFE